MKNSLMTAAVISVVLIGVASAQESDFVKQYRSAPAKIERIKEQFLWMAQKYHVECLKLRAEEQTALELAGNTIQAQPNPIISISILKLEKAIRDNRTEMVSHVCSLEDDYRKMIDVIGE